MRRFLLLLAVLSSTTLVVLPPQRIRADERDEMTLLHQALAGALEPPLTPLGAPPDWPPPAAHRAADGMRQHRIDGHTLALGLTADELAVHRAACETSGSKRCGEKRFANELPGVEVAVEAFLIDGTEVAVAQYQRCVAAGACLAVDAASCSIFTPEGEWHTGLELPEPLREPSAPQTCVTRAEAAAYCTWAGARLPTEAEWELAAGGADERVFPWSATWNAAHTHTLGDGYPGDVALPAGGGTPDGLLGMAGGVYEWTSDDACAYGDDYLACRDAQAEGAEGVVRGGSFASDGGGVRTTYRRFLAPDGRVVTSGIRCAADLSAAPSVERDVDVLRERLALPADTPSGTLLAAPDGTVWLGLGPEPLAVLGALPDTGPGGTCARPEPGGSWWLFETRHAALALELGEDAALWIADAECTWSIDFDIAADELDAISGEPIELVRLPDDEDGTPHGTERYEAELLPDEPGFERLVHEPSSLSLETADGRSLARHWIDGDHNFDISLEAGAHRLDGGALLLESRVWSSHEGCCYHDDAWSNHDRVLYVPGVEGDPIELESEASHREASQSDERWMEEATRGEQVPESLCRALPTDEWTEFASNVELTTTTTSSLLRRGGLLERVVIERSEERTDYHAPGGLARDTSSRSIELTLSFTPLDGAARELAHIEQRSTGPETCVRLAVPEGIEAD